MCVAVDQMLEEGRKQGHERGLSEGRSLEKEFLILKMLKTICPSTKSQPSQIKPPMKSRRLQKIRNLTLRHNVNSKSKKPTTLVKIV